MRRGLAAALFFGAFGSQHVAAQELCVRCDSPSALYRCTIQNSEKAGEFKGRGKAMEFICLNELARAGAHERCSVARDVGSVCLGDQRVVDGVGVRNSAGELIDPETSKAQANERAKNEPPRTLAEVARNTADLTKKTAKGAGDQINSAGEAVGGAVKKTFNCIFTLFTSC